MNLLEIPHDPRASWAGYALRAWLFAVIPSLIYFFALVFIGVDSLRPPARALDITFASYSILAAPLLETALMYALASLLALILPQKERLRVVLLAAICALAHKIGGGWEQVIASSWPFLIYSVTLTAWMKRSKSAAFALAVVVHVLYNATFFLVGVIGAFLTLRG